MLSSKAASDCDRIPVKPLTGSHNLSSMGRTCGPLRGGADFTGTVVFSMMACFLWSLGGCTLVWIRAGFSLAARLFKSVEVGPFGRCSRRVFPGSENLLHKGGQGSASSATDCSKLSI